MTKSVVCSDKSLKECTRLGLIIIWFFLQLATKVLNMENRGFVLYNQTVCMLILKDLMSIMFAFVKYVLFTRLRVKK